MKNRNIRLYPYSAFDNYQPKEQFSGWEPTHIHQDEDIFKQLKINLNKYQQKYNQSKEKNTANVSQPNSAKRTIQDKENLIRFPSIYSGPLKHNVTNKEPFAIKNRNILDDAMNHNEQNKGKFHKVLKLIRVRRFKHVQPAKPLNPDFQLNFDKKALPLKEIQATQQTRKNQRKLLTKRTSRKDNDHDFSDSRIVLHHDRRRLNQIELQFQKENE